MNIINYILNGFGFKDPSDFACSIDKSTPESYLTFLKVAFILGTIREFIEVYIGLDILVLACFVFLIVAEWWTGVKVDVIKRGNKFKSRKSGRMILKVGTYITILFVLFTFSSRTEKLEFVGFNLNPMKWIYYIVFVWIIMQLLVSWLENLAALGYKEMKGLVGVILRKGNKWFEFDGTKNGDNLFKNTNDDRN